MSDIDRSQKPSEQHPMGVAVCGTSITPGLIVFTNELRAGKVVPRDYGVHTTAFDEWFDVVYRTGSKVMQNPERVTTVFTDFDGRLLVAANVYAQGHDWSYPDGKRLCTLCGATTKDEGTCPGALEREGIER